MGDNLEFAGPDPTSYNISNELRDDFGRESLGIFDINNPDFGRESLNLLHSDIERESLGIVNLNTLDIGRDSLGITNIKTYDFLVSNVNLPEVTYNHDIPSISTSDISPDLLRSKTDENSNTNSILNMAFLQLPRTSVSSSISSINPSFNSNSLESDTPSRIYSSLGSSKNDLMNDAFGNSSDFLKKLHSAVSSFKSSIYSYANNNILNKPHRRICSLPSALESLYSDINTELVNLQIDKDFFLSSEDCKHFSEKKPLSFTEEVVEDNEFNDSVFIESKHMASRITDGSFIGTEDDMLDSIHEPEEFANVSDGDEEPIKYDTETVFKHVDKMFLPSDNHTVNSNPLEISHNSNRNSSRSSGSKSSKEALEIINTLSTILNSNPSEKQKSEGQHLLSSLAEIFLSSASAQSQSCILDDSGHSSIESDPHATPDGGKCYEILDLRKKRSSSATDVNKQNEENCVPLDLSMKSKSTCEKVFVSPKILPPRYVKNPHRSLSMQVNGSLGSTCSLSSNDSRNSNDSVKRFRPKKTEEKVTSLRKGPMRAVLPIDNMARRKSTGLKITPTRADLKPPSYKKKTSTPINESNMKPMAQSTPDNPNRNSVYTTSPLARPSQSLTSSPKVLKEKLNYSGSNRQNKDTRKIPTSELKRSSSGDLNKLQSTGTRFVRSYSLGAKSKPTAKSRTSTPQMSSAKQRPSSPLTNTEKKPALKENRSLGGGIRPPFVKKTGKENKH